MNKKICKHPFYTIQIQSTGEVYCCCCYWTDFYSFGNIFEQSFDEIWNGEKAQQFRRQFIDNDYKYCKLEYCDPYLCEFTPSLISEYPKQVEFSYDRRCNIRCIFCRDNASEEEKRFNIEKAQRVEQNFDKIFSTVLQHAEIVELNSAGELFASKQSIEILKKIIDKYPHIRFKIISNGILFSKEMIDKLNIKGKMYSVTISIHAATKKTYNKLIEHGNFDAVLENVKYLSELKKQGLLSALQLNFVVTGYNYKEMKKFVMLAKELDARAFFINYHRQISSDKLQNELDISLPTHPKYNHLIKLLHDPIFKDEHCCINSYLLNLKPVKKNIKIKIKEWLKIH